MELPAAKKVIPAFENLYLFKASTSIIFPLKDIFCPTLFSDATKKSLSNFRFDFSKIGDLSYSKWRLDGRKLGVSANPLWGKKVPGHHRLKHESK